MDATQRLYLQDDMLCETTAVVTDVRGNAFAVDRTCFYPGGGGQPADEGQVFFRNGQTCAITAASSDENGIIWHQADSLNGTELIGQPVTLKLNRDRRVALSRYHTVLHVLNTIALREYDAWMTGAQIGVDYSRIDFKVERFTKEMAAELEAKVNDVISGGHEIRTYSLLEEEFNRRDDLLRTLEVRPPVVDGRVRIVEIAEFDAQACGGTHVHSTAELGGFSIYKMENKGKINKRLYVRLAEVQPTD